MLGKPLTETDIGPPRTQEVNVPFIFDASLAGTGYNSSGDLGPVCNPPKMELDINVEKEEAVAGGLEVENGNTNCEQGTALTNKTIDLMIIKDLKDALEAIQGW